ncbi:uncharacterized protein LOC135831382 isoform X2 [Planococcus citri]|uniref:uncharacterized protein LOC135831382 isoform X2 n=1 Tax=Planococcus citri TaxID=170843 RepID=UPI0031F87229
MNINRDIVSAILTHGHGKKSSFEILDWRIDDIAETTSNNYTTQISRLIIRYRSPEEDDSVPKEKICFVKVPIAGPLNDLIVSSGGYEKETLMYTEVLPRMYTIEKEFFTPRLYYSDDKMSLVLKDLTQSGYKCADRVQKLDVEHCIYALKCLAKFHALSVKLETTNGLPEVVKCNAHSSATAEKFNIFITQQMPQFIHSLPQDLKERYPGVITYLKYLSIETVINALNDSSFEKFNVLNHGDLSINNIMFKYDKYGIVRKAKLIDFQFTSWNSPAKDLTYFFITCMEFEEYERYFPLLLGIYLNTLNKILHQLECPTYNMQSLLDEMNTIHAYAWYILSCSLPYLIRDPSCSIDTKFEQEHYRHISVKWFEYLARKGPILSTLSKL